MQEPPALEVQVVEALTKQATPNKLTLPTSAADDSPATTPCEAMEGGGLTPTGGDGSASDAQSLLGYQARSTRALRSDRKADPEVVLEHRFTRWERVYFIVMLSLTVMFLFADQNLMAPNLSAMAKDFDFTDEQKDMKLGGEVSLGFFLVGAPVALLVGYLADTRERRALFVGVVLLGEVPCLLTYWVTQYWQLLLLRCLTGISIGGATPLVFSIIGDLFSVENRVHVAVIPGMSMGIGQLVGQAMAGYIGDKYNWRLPFVLVAVPTMVLALALGLTTREPPRGLSEVALTDKYERENNFEYRAQLDWSKFVAMWKTRSNQAVFAQAILGCVPWGVLIVYFNDFVAQDKNMGVVGATNVMITFGVGCALGTIGGGLLGQHLYNTNHAQFAVFVSGSTLLGTIPIVAIVNMNFTDIAAVMVLAFFGGALSSVPAANIRAVLLNVNAPETRGTIFSFYALMDDLGKGLGPGLVALLISGTNRVTAFNIAVWAWAPCAFFQLMLLFTLAEDEQTLQEVLQQQSNDRDGDGEGSCVELADDG